MKAVIRTSVQHSSVVLGKSLLLWNLEALRDNGVDEVYLIGPKFENTEESVESLKDLINALFAKSTHDK
jgi:NDP-sugar pyrophosphorylase family protein